MTARAATTTLLTRVATATLPAARWALAIALALPLAGRLPVSGPRSWIAESWLAG